MKHFSEKSIHTHIFIALTFLVQYLPAQVSPLLTQPLYGEQFESLEGEKWVAERLGELDFQAMGSQGIISRESMAGLALPLGIHNHEGPIDFQKGMRDMYLAKARFASDRDLQLDPQIMLMALKYLGSENDPASLTTLLDYRTEVLTPALDRIAVRHSEVRGLFSPERRQFMDIIMAHLSPNVLMGFNLQELLPTEAGPYRAWINPLFKAYYYDRLLREAGMDFVAVIPARYDAMLSFGPFQLTQIALDDVHANRRLPEHFSPHGELHTLTSLSDQAEATAYFAYSNWERLSFFMQTYGGLENFNEYFGKTPLSPDRQRELRIWIAGVTACMHHQPIPTWNLAQSYIKVHEDLTGFSYLMFDFGEEEGVPSNPVMLRQLKKYYRSSAEAYLIMKVYHALISE